MIGKERRLKKFFDDISGNTVLVPMDHGITIGPVNGLKNINKTIFELSHSNINGMIMHKGNAKAALNKMPLIIHLNASTEISPDCNLKTVVCTVEEAVKLGADAVSIHINLGAKNEAKMLQDLGTVGKICDDWGMPLLAMMYVRGDGIEEDAFNIKLAARVASELGADIVKVNFTGDVKSFREVVEGCPVPVIVAGGNNSINKNDVLENFKMAIKAGARGVACGRNIFQSNSPVKFANQVCEIVHGAVQNNLKAM